MPYGINVWAHVPKIMVSEGEYYGQPFLGLREGLTDIRFA